MAHTHAHNASDAGNERALRIALLLTTAFLVVEIVGGILTNSLALISDAAHMFTDTAALAIALAAVRIAKRPADARRTFGYYRFEILAATVNTVLLFAVAIYILIEAYQRLKQPPEIASFGMLIVAIVGLCVNLISMRLLSGGKQSSLNVKGAYLEVWSDMLGSIGVITGALLIQWTRWWWIDSVVAVAIGLWVLPRTWVMFRQTLNVLLEGVPEDLRLSDVENEIRGVDGVADVHDLHVWAISSGKVSATVHVVATVPDTQLTTVMKSVRTLLADRFEIHHSTVQVEQQACEQAAGVHGFGPDSGTMMTEHSHKH